jgi:hypothetical protein
MKQCLFLQAVIRRGTVYARNGERRRKIIKEKDSMAHADIFTKWGDQPIQEVGGDYGTGETSGQSGVYAAEDHAERKAWKSINWKKIEHYIKICCSPEGRNTPDSKGEYTQEFDIVIAVDQQICASCQRWMVNLALPEMHTMVQHFNLPENIKLTYKLLASVQRKIKKKTAVYYVEVNKKSYWSSDVGSRPYYANFQNEP